MHVRIVINLCDFKTNEPNGKFYNIPSLKVVYNSTILKLKRVFCIKTHAHT